MSNFRFPRSQACQAGGLACAAMLAPASPVRSDPAPTADLVIHDTGRVILHSELTLNNGEVIIEGGGVMETHSGSVTTADTLEIQLNGLLVGCGTINATVINLGTIQSECGPATYLVVNGDLTNDGSINVGNGSGLQVSGTLTNNDLLDTRGGSMTATIFVNNGTYLSGSSGNDLDIVSANKVGNDFLLRAVTLSTRSYVMEVNPDVSTSGWTQVGFPQTGADGPLTFTHSGAATGHRMFYRIRAVTP